MTKITRRDFLKRSAAAATAVGLGMRGDAESSPLDKPPSEKHLAVISLEQLPASMRLVMDDGGNFFHDGEGRLFAYERHLTKAPRWVQDRIKSAERKCKVLNASAADLIVTACMNNHLDAASTGNSARYTMRASASRRKYEALLGVYGRARKDGFVRPDDMLGVDAGVADPQAFFAGDPADPSWIKSIPRLNGVGFHIYDRNSLSMVSFAPLGIGAYWDYYTAEKARDFVAAHGIGAEIQGSVSLDGKAREHEKRVVGGVYYMRGSPLSADEREIVGAQATFYLEGTGKTDSRYLISEQLDAISEYMMRTDGVVDPMKLRERALFAASVNKYNQELWSSVKNYVDAGLLVRGKDSTPALAEGNIERGLSPQDSAVLTVQCGAFLSGDSLNSRLVSTEHLAEHAGASTVNGKLSVPYFTSLVLGNASRLDDMQDLLRAGVLKTEK